MRILSLILLSLLSLHASVNLNTASEEQLATLKGIGPAKAKAIIEYRTKNRGFKKVEDILIVKGIGPKIFDTIKNDITVAP